MKKCLVFGLVLILLLAAASPALAGNGNGGRGSGAGKGGGGRGSYTLVGIVTEIDTDKGTLSVEVYGGKNKSIIGEEVVVQTDSTTRFLLQDSGLIEFEDISIDDPVSVAIGSDGVADRVTIVVDCPCLP